MALSVHGENSNDPSRGVSQCTAGVTGTAGSNRCLQIHRIMQPLLASQVAFWRLDQSMSKEKTGLASDPPPAWRRADRPCAALGVDTVEVGPWHLSCFVAAEPNSAPSSCSLPFSAIIKDAMSKQQFQTEESSQLLHADRSLTLLRTPKSFLREPSPTPSDALDKLRHLSLTDELQLQGARRQWHRLARIDLEPATGSQHRLSPSLIPGQCGTEPRKGPSSRHLGTIAALRAPRISSHNSPADAPQGLQPSSAAVLVVRLLLRLYGRRTRVEVISRQSGRREKTI